MRGVMVRVLFATDQALMLEVELDAGAEVPTHEHRHDSFCFVTRGRAEITIDDETTVVVSGDAFIHEVGVPHSATAIEATRWIEVKSPPEVTW